MTKCCTCIFGWVQQCGLRVSGYIAGIISLRGKKKTVKKKERFYCIRQAHNEFCGNVTH